MRATDPDLLRSVVAGLVGVRIFVTALHVAGVLLFRAPSEAL